VEADDGVLGDEARRPLVASTPEGSNPLGRRAGSQTGADSSWQCSWDDEIFSAHVRGTDHPFGQR
jgi:hypothetical protein